MEAQIAQNLHMSQKDEEEDQQTKKQLIKSQMLEKTTAKQENPKHDTDWDHSKPRAHWNKKNQTYVVDQLYKRNWKWPRLPNGKIEKVNLPELKRILMDMIGVN